MGNPASLGAMTKQRGEYGGTEVLSDDNADMLELAIEQKEGRAIREGIVDLQKRALDAQPA